MKRQHQIPALAKAQAIAASITNPSIEAFKASGGRIIGCFSPDTPVEILEAAGLFPYDMQGTGATGTEYAEAYFRQLTCEFTRATFSLIADGSMNFLDGAVIYNCCDHLRRIADNWRTLPQSPFIHFLYIPKRRGEDAYGRYKEEIRSLIAAIETRFGTAITEEKLRAAIAAANETRALIRELYALRATEAVLIDGAETAAVLAAGGALPRAEYNALLSELIAELKSSGESIVPRRRLFLAAGHCSRPEFLEAIESQGGIVVGDSLARGLKSCMTDIAQDGDPLENLCRSYFWEKSPMPRVFNTQDERIEWILAQADASHADGIISARLTMCDLWAFEQYMLTDALSRKEIPSLELEASYLLEGTAQIRTRVQAFVENCPRRAIR